MLIFGRYGEKNAGFDVLYHNMKHGQIAAKELAEFVRERAAIEETYSKSMSKLAKMASNGSPLGTFAPMWDVFRVSSDKLALCHLELMKKMNDLIRDINKYSEEQVKIHRKTKEEVIGTLESVQSLQVQNGHLQKAREGYHSKCTELERLRKEGVPQKELEKAELKSKKAAESFAGSIEKFNRAGRDFEQKMSESAQKFQDIEEAHLRQMKVLIKAYSHSIEDTHVQVGQVHEEFKQNVENIGIENLIRKFTEQKGTGKERPGESQKDITLSDFPRNCISVLLDSNALKIILLQNTRFYNLSYCAFKCTAHLRTFLKLLFVCLCVLINFSLCLTDAAFSSDSSSPENVEDSGLDSPSHQPLGASPEPTGWAAWPSTQSQSKDSVNLSRSSDPFLAAFCDPSPGRSPLPQDDATNAWPSNLHSPRAPTDVEPTTFSFPAFSHNLASSELKPSVWSCKHIPPEDPFLDAFECLSRGPSPISLTSFTPSGGQSLLSHCILSFRLVNISRVDHFLPNQKLLYSDPSQSDPDTKDFWFNMPALTLHLQREAELNPQASYYNVALLKYQASSQDPGRAPLLLSAECQRSGTVTRVSLDYHCCPATAPATQLTSVQALLPLDHTATDLQCQPPASWNTEERRLLWKLSNLSPTNHSKGSGTLCASWQCLEVPRGPPPSLAVQFVGSGASLSGLDVELVGSRYRMSLVKKRFATGKYMAGCSL
uniref:F-BAR domain only protein 1-like n=1 Tax=Sinocyclocheilus anshuiensis TaxID=1608454 RepID=A0A671KYC8_9TELE